MTGARTVGSVARWNPRYVAYARANGMDPDAQLAADRKRYPGGVMAGFVAWIGERWRAWQKAVGRKDLEVLTDEEHRAFDEWLASWPEVAS